jgi:heme-degrading monooxygenase HmoA
MVNLFAWVTHLSINPIFVEEILNVFNKYVMPFFKENEGFKGIYISLNPDTHKVMSYSLWESREYVNRIFDENLMENEKKMLFKYLQCDPLFEFLEMVAIFR